MARHRGAFDPTNPEPYELSRSRIDTFIKCRACFWLQQIKRVSPPEIPSFTINTTTDILLKRDADGVRGKSALPIWEANGLGHIIPFEHEHLENWTNSLNYGKDDTYFNFVHPETNIKLGGGLDDVFVNTENGELHIVDYKSTAQGTRSPEKYVKKPVSIDDPWKLGYKRQMDMYVWVMRKKGYDVSSTGYFVYVDAQHKDIMGMLTDSDPATAWMKFSASIIPYEVDTSWVEPTLLDIKRFLLEQKTCPEHTPIGNNYSGCDLGRYFREAVSAQS
ncbi:PD-(D/E)XK nuclease family protein [Gammaproteobacteria bacterium]|nr:PD-(D/E)XK nuclease family protein [Gammaproteobacteria bacterium]